MPGLRAHVMTGCPPNEVYLEARFQLDGHGIGDIRDITDLDSRIFDSPFRRSLRLKPKPETQLRTLAREQAHQTAEVTQHPAITSTAAAAALAAIEIPPWACPGEFGADGVWQEHCKISTERDDQ